MIDAGNLCIYCDRDTYWGSGRFVNRIPADDGERDGWMCEECQHGDDEDDDGMDERVNE